ncbi:MAG: sodium-dependent transporter [bacterium]|nr:MAG: sodium-dependent transporter [bacterium]
MEKRDREMWATRLGLILAMAGNAIGLGNFLRFPVKAAQNGGGAFMIPYFTALLLLGIPLMWVEWGIGRHSGRYGFGSAVGGLGKLCRSSRLSLFANYLGVLGIVIPLAFAIYYTYIESWTLAYSFFSITSRYAGPPTLEGMSGFLAGYQGREFNDQFSGLGTAAVFFILTISLNLYVLSRGISKGIEKLAKIAMPLLFLFAFILLIRVLTLGTPNPDIPENNVSNGFAFLWNPDYSHIKNASTWLAAAGQIFFTLSIGTGSILTYASYLKRRDDIVLTGLTTSMTNEFAEVILGGSISIPVSVAFFGLLQTTQIANGGAFNLGFVAMPVIFYKLPFGSVFGMLWFSLLFFAGITSSVALCSPAMAFLQDHLKFSRQKATLFIGSILLFGGFAVLLFLKHGFLDEMDFWAGTFGLVLFALVEVIFFIWIFGINSAWTEMHEGADLQIPKIFKWILKYVSPLYLVGLIIFWGYQDGIPILLMKQRNPADIPYLWGARLLILGLLILFLIFTYKSLNRKKTISNININIREREQI